MSERADVERALALGLIDAIPQRVLAGMTPAEWAVSQTEARAAADAALGALGPPPAGTRAHHPVHGWGVVLKVWKVNAPAGMRKQDGVRMAWDCGEVTAVLPDSLDPPEVVDDVPELDLLPHHSLAEIVTERHQLQWLVRDFWTLGGFGQFAGPEKSLKTYLALMVTLAVVSGGKLFGHFDVVTQGPVVLFTGEGTRHLVERRLRHLAQLYGITDEAFADLPIEVVDIPAQAQSAKFQKTLRAALDAHPVLIVVDPLYTYHGGSANAGNVHEASEVLTAISVPTVQAGVALIIVNHFNKAGSQTLELSSITQAGGREWVNNWLLVKHRQPADLIEQRFWLEFVVGSREGYGGHYDLDVTLGPLDPETLRHFGVPKVLLNFHQAPAAEAEVSTEEAIRAVLLLKPFTLTKSDIRQRVKGGNAAVPAILADMVVRGVVAVQTEKRTRADGRTRSVEVYGLAVAVQTDTNGDTHDEKIQ